MDFTKINEYSVYKRNLMNTLNKQQKRKSELDIEQKEVKEEMKSHGDNPEYKRQLKSVKDELKEVSDDIRILKDDIKHISYIINILSYIGDDEKIVEVKNNI